MNRGHSHSGLGLYISIILIACLPLLDSCQSTSQEVVSGAGQSMSATFTAEKPEPEKKESAQQESTPIKIEKKSQNYFGSVEKEFLTEIYKGSPASISRALNKFHKAAIEYTESEKVLYNIADRIMNIVWTHETALINVPKLNSVSPAGSNYIAVIESARSGVFEEKKGEKDFFLTVLPALTILSGSNVSADYGAIEQALFAGIKECPDSVLCNYLLGMLYKKQRNYEKALTYFDHATETNAVVYEVLVEKSDCLIKLGRYDSVVSILDRLVVQFPSDVQVLKLYANASLTMGDYAKAELYASQVLQQNPSDLEFVLFRAKIFVETGEYLKASSLLDVYAKTYPTQHEYLLLRARLQKDWNKNLNAAITTIEKGLALYPDDSDIILYASQLASETGHKVSGRTGGELADLILKDDPQNMRALQYSVQSYYNDEKYAEAYAVSKKLMAKSNVGQSATAMHIKVCIALHYNDEAWRYASSMYEKNPESMDIIQYYIQVMVATGRTQNALRLINSQLSGNPNASMKSFLYYERSFIQGNETAALSDLRSSLIANPRNSDALFRMYQIYYNRKDYRKAQYYLKQVVSLNPNDEKYVRLNMELDQLVK